MMSLAHVVFALLALWQPPGGERWLVRGVASLALRVGVGRQSNVERERVVGAAGPEQRAIAFLASQVPTWFAENRCYSCHHNADAAVALFEARRLGYTVPDDALDDTISWLRKPRAWDNNGGEGPFSDKRLARIQFASALVAAMNAGAIIGDESLKVVAVDLARDQAADGVWPTSEADASGTPAGSCQSLSTVMARNTLRRIDAKRYASAIGLADEWLDRQPITTTPVAAAVLFQQRGDDGDRKNHARVFLRRSQNDDGGWGPRRGSPTETFDTALAAVALAMDARVADRDRLRRARALLIGTQQPSGYWTETTRPPGGESYAQRVSTTSWALRALLATAKPRGD